MFFKYILLLLLILVSENGTCFANDNLKILKIISVSNNGGLNDEAECGGLDDSDTYDEISVKYESAG